MARVRGALDESLAIDGGNVVERDLPGPAIVESDDALIVTTRVSDGDASSIENDAQLLVEPSGRPTGNAIAASCAPILVTTASSACRFGTSGALVEAIPGATYAWTVDGAAITGGDGTSRINLAFGGASSATVSVVARTPDGCTRNGAATITLRDPFRIASLVAPASMTIGSPVTLSWSIAGTDIPRSQRLLINGTAVPTAINDRSYTFTPTTVGSYSAQLDASLLGGRRRTCCRSAVEIPAVSFCGADTRTASFTVTPPCVPATGDITIGSSVTKGGTLTGSVTASGSWTLTSALGNAVTPSTGTGSHTFTYSGSIIGNDTLQLHVDGACGSVTRTASVTVRWGIPTVSLTADSTTVWFNHSTTMHATIGNAPAAPETSYTITSSRGNDFDLLPTAGNDSLTFQYDRDNSGFDDTVTLTVTSPGGSATASLIIHDNSSPCPTPPTISNVSVTPASVPVGGTATIHFTVTGQYFSAWNINSNVLGNTTAPYTGTQTGPITITYTATQPTKGVDTVQIQAYGHPCGFVFQNVQVTVN